MLLPDAAQHVTPTFLVDMIAAVAAEFGAGHRASGAGIDNP
jgi:hypothetical protein